MDSANANLGPSCPATLAGHAFAQRSLFQPQQPQEGLRRGKVLLTAPIHALTVSQPYASLIANGEKWVENRCWATNHRGPLAIHAGKGTQYLSHSQLRDQGYSTGAVVAVVQLDACIQYLPTRLRRDGSRVLDRLGISVDEFLEYEHAEGPYCWILSRIRKLAMPYPCRGAQGLWMWGRNALILDVVEIRP